MNRKINKKVFFVLWTLFLGISIVFRCKATLFYQKTIVEYLIILSLTLISLVIYITSEKNKKIYLFELLLLITPAFFLQNGELNKYTFYSIIGILYYFIIQEEPDVLGYIKYPIILFALLTAVVSWLAFFNPNFYISKVLTIFEESSALKYSFLHRGMNHGFTNHYSRNAFYIAIGIIVAFCNLLSDKKKSKINILILMFLSCTMFLVAKRGTTLFLIMAILISIILKEKNISKKIGKLFKFVLIGGVFLVIAYFTVPGVSNLLVRIVEMGNSDDISTGRFYLYRIAWKMFRNNPILGMGWGSFLEAMIGTTFQAVHNDYIQLLAETGIIGTIIFISFNLYNLYYTYKAYKLSFSTDNSFKKVACFSFVYQVFFMLYSLTGYPHFSYEQMLLYLMVSGAGLGIYKNVKKIGSEIK